MVFIINIFEVFSINNFLNIFWKKVLDINGREKISFEKVSKYFVIGKNTVFVFSKNIL
ncbi:transposase [Orientia tsutsugamushi str. Gilliam]|uniref:Transposase n=1 Tax=Orientia tsutsugamushi str. Gilliam TaxID=1359184 RepID=A0A2U3R6X3_ORITS|nr:transposase [Orientia tsutsugamushi str. Gilliam]